MILSLSLSLMLLFTRDIILKGQAHYDNWVLIDMYI